MYADDVVILTNNHAEAQKGLDIMTNWCQKWHMKVNIKKSQTIHHRNPQRRRCQQPLMLSGAEMEYVSDYKYLGCWVNEFSNNNKTVEALTAAAGRSYGRIIDLIKRMGDMGYNSYCTLYHSYVLPVANYAAAVWGFKDYPAPRVLQNRISRMYLGVHRFAPVAATGIEMGLPLIKGVRWSEMLQYVNRVKEMSDDRLPKIIFNYDVYMKKKSWVHDVAEVARQLHLPSPLENCLYDMDTVEVAVKHYSMNEHWKEVASKSKLRYYREFKDRENIDTLVKANLPRRYRSILAKFSCGVLPIENETGRFEDVDRELRLCKTCNTGVPEDEYHFLFKCAPLQVIRDEFYESRSLHG